jgi:CBS domain-containing protein
MKVADIMTRDVVTVHPDATVSEIAWLLRTSHIGSVPVVDADNRVVGIVSDHDLLRQPPGDSPRAWWLRLFDEEAVCLEDIATARQLKTQDVMRHRVTTISDTAPIGILASLMRRRRLKHVPVVHRGKLVGIVSRGDLLDALARDREEEFRSSPAA